MVRWVVGSIPHGGPIELFLHPASAILWCIAHIKDPLLLIKNGPCSGGSGFPRPYVRRDITIYKIY